MKTFVFIVITLLATAAWAQRSEDIKVFLTWDPVTTNVDGEPDKPAHYLIYVCDSPISSRFADPISTKDLVGVCDGHLAFTTVVMTKDIPIIYRVNKKKGCLYYRVSARKAAEDGNGNPIFLESDLSNQVFYEYDIKRGLKAPENLKINPVK